MVDSEAVKDQPAILNSIEKLQAEIDTSQDSSALFETDEFRIYCYKVKLRSMLYSVTLSTG